MKIEKRDFDKMAADYDEKPARVKLANDITESILREVSLKPEMTAMDFGCGTGLLTLHIAPLVKSITGVDSSKGMLDVLSEKINKENFSNVNTLKIDPDSGAVLRGKYDLIVSAMTLHHIQNTEPLIAQFYNALNPSGYICIADLDTEPGNFHDDNTGVFHFGFDRESLKKIFSKAGFTSITQTTAAEINKPAPEDEKRKFTVLLIIGKK